MSIRAKTLLGYGFLWTSLVLLFSPVKSNNFMPELFNNHLYYCSILYAIAILFFVSADNRYAVTISFAALGILLIWKHTIFNIIDEGAHFSYIQTLIQEKRLPLVAENYEAFQPPVYYSLAALLTFPLKNEIISVYFLRGINLIIVVVIFLLNIKLTTLLQKYEVILSGKYILLALPTIFSYTPGMINRGATINNECLIALFGTLLFYQISKMILEDDNRMLIYIPFTIALAFMTKITSIVFLVPYICVLIYKKKYKYIIFSLFFLLIFTLPWFLFNFDKYGSFTAIKEHVDFVYPVVNPLNVRITIKDIIKHSIFSIRSYVLPQEIHPGFLGNFVSGINLIFMALLISISFFRFWKFAFEYIKKKLSFNYEIEEKKHIIEMVASCMMIGLFCAHVFSTVTQNYILLAGRYFLSLNSAFLALYGIYCIWIPKKVRFFAIMPYLFFLSATMMSYLCDMI